MKKNNTEEKELNLDAESQYIREVNALPLLEDSEQERLFIEFKNGKMELRNKLIESNLRLVVSIARDYKGYNVPFLERVQDGNIGLIKAVDTYNPTNGNKFSSYAYPIINNEIVVGLAKKGHSIAPAQNTVCRYYKFLKKINELSTKLEREPTKKEVLDYLKISSKLYDDILIFAKGSISLNETVPNEANEYYTYGDIVADKRVNIEEDFLYEELKKELELAIKSSLLNERELKIIVLKFNLLDNKKFKCRTLAERYNVSRQRIDKMEKEALQKIRKWDRRHHLLEQYR